MDQALQPKIHYCLLTWMISHTFKMESSKDSINGSFLKMDKMKKLLTLTSMGGSIILNSVKKVDAMQDFYFTGASRDL